jgi:hypothetical protein
MKASPRPTRKQKCCQQTRRQPPRRGRYVHYEAAMGLQSLLMFCMAYAPAELMDRIAELLEEGARYASSQRAAKR